MKIEDAVKNVFSSVATGTPVKMGDVVKAALAVLAGDKTKFACEIREDGTEHTVSDRVRAFVNNSADYEIRTGKGGGVFRAGEAPPKAVSKPVKPLTSEQLKARIAKMQATLAARETEQAPAA